jgi:hypothetical protein
VGLESQFYPRIAQHKDLSKKKLNINLKRKLPFVSSASLIKGSKKNSSMCAALASKQLI